MRTATLKLAPALVIATAFLAACGQKDAATPQTPAPAGEAMVKAIDAEAAAKQAAAATASAASAAAEATQAPRPLLKRRRPRPMRRRHRQPPPASDFLGTARHPRHADQSRWDMAAASGATAAGSGTASA
ncbi:hypothetical protein [Ottowia beijingensis]|uniref:hypothetical protein n=1 Tax=Ottowia beijingensis TaxID=1207057 RepID=UPI00214D8ECE|nr:hypothetical protein [Ottowia beijingensis]